MDAHGDDMAGPRSRTEEMIEAQYDFVWSPPHQLNSSRRVLIPVFLLISFTVGSVLPHLARAATLLPGRV